MEISDIHDLNTILSEIKEESHFEDLKIKIKEFLLRYDMSLYDAYVLKGNDAVKFDGFGEGKLKLLNELRYSINNNPELYSNYYFNNIANNTLPVNFNIGKSPKDIVLDCIEDIIDILRNKMLKKYSRYADILEKYYGINSLQKSRNEIADEFGISKERVRQVIEKFSYKNLINSEGELNYKLKYSFIQLINDLVDKTIYTSNFISELTHKGDDIDITLVNKIAIFLNSEIADVDGDYYLVDSVGIMTFSKQYKELYQKLNKQITPLEFNEIAILIKSTDNDLLKLILERHEKIEMVKFQDKITYQVKWQFLSSLTSRTKRILFEIDEILSLSEILEKYNNRLNEIGEQSISIRQLLIRTDNTIFPIQDGRWKFEPKSKRKPKRIDARNLIETYVKNKKGVTTFDEIKKMLKDNDLQFPDKSLRTYISLSCIATCKEGNVYVHKGYKK